MSWAAVLVGSTSVKCYNLWRVKRQDTLAAVFVLSIRHFFCQNLISIWVRFLLLNLCRTVFIPFLSFFTSGGSLANWVSQITQSFWQNLSTLSEYFHTNESWQDYHHTYSSHKWLRSQPSLSLSIWFWQIFSPFRTFLRDIWPVETLPLPR